MNLVKPNTVLDTCGSTNDLAKRLGEAGLPHGTWISSLEQTTGRGRLGRTWISKPGNLFISFVLRGIPMDRWTWVPMLTALACARAIERVDGKSAIRVKWPNDLGFPTEEKNGFLKVGGILCESVASSTHGFIVAGIGLNCEAEVDVDRPAARLNLPLTAVRASVIEEILKASFDPAVAAEEFWRRAWKKPGDGIEFEALSGPDRAVKSAEIVELGSHGELRVKLASGETRVLLSEEIRVSRTS